MSKQSVTWGLGGDSFCIPCPADRLRFYFDQLKTSDRPRDRWADTLEDGMIEDAARDIAAFECSGVRDPIVMFWAEKIGDPVQYRVGSGRDILNEVFPEDEER